MWISVCEDASVLGCKGPMLLNVLAFREDRPDIDLAKAGIEKAFTLLDVLVQYKHVITSNITRIDTETSYPSVVKKMVDATLQTGDATLTPLAAVAGAVSDEVGDFLFQQGGVSKVIVNNGGDMTIRLKPGYTAKVGVNLDYAKRTIPYVLTVSKEVCGVTTSGLGGRSFTKGIASAATVWATNASIADALSTVIGNNTNVDDPLIVRQLAEEIYPATDIPGHLVTVSVGDISESQIQKALDNGIAAVHDIRNKQGLRFEAIIAVKGFMRMTEGIAAHLVKIDEPEARAK